MWRRRAQPCTSVYYAFTRFITQGLIFTRKRSLFWKWLFLKTILNEIIYNHDYIDTYIISVTIATLFNLQTIIQ